MFTSSRSRQTTARASTQPLPETQPTPESAPLAATNLPAPGIEAMPTDQASVWSDRAEGVPEAGPSQPLLAARPLGVGESAQADLAAAKLPSGAVSTAGGPPTWLMIASAGALISLAAVLVFWPGATLLDRLRALDGGICAQLPTHSFYPGGQRLPLCARNTGIYLGYSITFIALFFSKRLRATEFPRWPMAIVLGLCILALGVDGFNSLFLDLHLPHLYQPHNLLRLTTGLLTGTAMACFLVPVTNVTLWQDTDHKRTVDSWWQLLRLLPILALAFLAVGTQAAIFLYPVAILSSLGVMTVLCMINITIVVAISGKACLLTNVRQLFPFIATGFLLATGELAGLFFLNHWLLLQLTA